MECGLTEPASLRLNIGCQDHLAPFHSLVGDKLGEIGWRARQYGRAEIGEPRLEVGIGKARIDLRVQRFNDLCGRVLRSGDALPSARPAARAPRVAMLPRRRAA